MKLNKTTKILVGLGTIWFVLFPLMFIVLWFAMVAGSIFSSKVAGPDFPFFMLPFFAIFPLQCITVLLQFVLISFYFIHILKNTQAPEIARILLGIGCYFIPFFAMPIYFCLYVWLDTPPEWASVQAPAAPPA